jgi:hypothetical protein
MPDDEESKPSRADASTDVGTAKNEETSRIIEQLVATGKLLLVAAIFVFVAVNWSFFLEWLRTVKHAEAPFGWKVDREVELNIDNLFGPQNNVHRDGDPHIVRAAVQYAELVGRATQGAKIIWVDPHPDNNRTSGASSKIWAFPFNWHGQRKRR